MNLAHIHQERSLKNQFSYSKNRKLQSLNIEMNQIRKKKV